MPTNQNHRVRSNISEVKSQIEKKIGKIKTENYLNLLSRFLSSKISKSDFDKLCIATLKKENLSLHNALLKGILSNVCFSKTPSLIRNGSNGFDRSISHQSLCKDLPKSPRKGRSFCVRDRKFKDGFSKGKSQVTTEVVVSSSGRQQCSLEDGEEVDQSRIASFGLSNQSIEAPLGVNLIHRQKSKHIGTCYSSNELLDSISLKKKLEDGLRIEEGFEVSIAFSNLLNASLDVFLKRLIKPCLELAALRSSATQGDPHQGLCSASMADFQVAMELNPTLLGQNWPEKLEKIRLVTPYLPADSDT